MPLRKKTSSKAGPATPAAMPVSTKIPAPIIVTSSSPISRLRRISAGMAPSGPSRRPHDAAAAGAPQDRPPLARAARFGDNGVMIIDCHVHLNNYHEQTAVSLDESLDKLQAAMAEAGV